MKNIIYVVLGLLVAVTSVADTYVKGYFKQNGTYVQPYYRTSPNSNPYDNYSSPGNYNPYTGRTAPSGNNSLYGNPYQSNQNLFTTPPNNRSLYGR